MPMASGATPQAVPDGWRVVRLGEVAEVIGGSTPSRTQPDYWGGAIPWVVPSELTKLPGRYLERSRQSVTGEGLRAAGLRILPAGSTLLTSRATIGATAINAVPVTTNQGFQSLVPGSDADSLWLFYCVSALGHELQRRGAGSTFREVSRDGVRTIPILLPPLAEQRGIAAVLDAIDEAIERSQAVIAATEELRRSLLHELLSRGVPGWHSEWREVRGLGVVPACWEVNTVGDAYNVQLGKMLSAKTRIGDYVRPYLTNRNVRWGAFNLDDLPAMHFSPKERVRLRLEPDDLLVCEGGEVGRSAVWRGELTECYYQKALHRLRPRSADAQSPEFARYALEYANMRGWFTDYTGQTSIAHLTREKLISMRLPFPSFAEQQAITAALGAVDASLEESRVGTDVLRSVKASASEALLSGRVRVAHR